MNTPISFALVGLLAAVYNGTPSQDADKDFGKRIDLFSAQDDMRSAKKADTPRPQVPARPPSAVTKVAPLNQSPAVPFSLLFQELPVAPMPRFQFPAGALSPGRVAPASRVSPVAAAPVGSTIPMAVAIRAPRSNAVPPFPFFARRPEQVQPSIFRSPVPTQLAPMPVVPAGRAVPPQPAMPW